MRASRAQLILAFTAVYVIWGSTYLAIRYAIETLPPFLMAGTRFLIAGTLLSVYAFARGARAQRRHWRPAAIAGALLLLGGNGAVVWSELRVASGAAALLVATVPLWIVILEWLRPGGERPAVRVLVGVLLGLGGLAVLIGPGELAGAKRLDLLGATVLIAGSLSWSIGSLYARQAELPRSPILSVGMEMLCGGAALTLAGLVAGEHHRVALASLTPRSLLAFAYLVTFGAVVAFTAYVWLLRASTPARVATYAYVNPVVAVVLGWSLGGEPLAPRTLLAAAVIVAGVAAITTAAPRPVRSPRAEPDLSATLEGEVT